MIGWLPVLARVQCEVDLAELAAELQGNRSERALQEAIIDCATLPPDVDGDVVKLVDVLYPGECEEDELHHQFLREVRDALNMRFPEDD